jgi:hypothetical protein
VIWRGLGAGSFGGIIEKIEGLLKGRPRITTDIFSRMLKVMRHARPVLTNVPSKALIDITHFFANHIFPKLVSFRPNSPLSSS